MQYNKPSVNPANLDSLVGLVNESISKSKIRTDGMLPVQVINFDRNANRVDVQPLIMILGTSGELVERPVIHGLPTLVLGGGGFLLSFPINPGDLGWILANDRDISLFLQTYARANPNTNRVKSFSDAVFIPDIMRGFTIAGADSAKVCFQNLSGSVKITLSGNTIELTAPNVVVNSGLTTVNGDLLVNGAITATEGMNLSGGSGPNSMTITGNTRVVGDITASGNITAHVP